jgi:serine/threonine protein kinase
MLMGHPPFIGHDTMSTYQKILAGKVAFPKDVDPRGKSLIKNLLQADLTKRFGNLKNGIDDIKSSPWFEGIDWKALLLRSVPAPYIPPVEGVKDTSNFENYPDSCEETDVVAPSTTDPFADW